MMPKRQVAAITALAVLVLAVSLGALWIGLRETRLVLSGPRRSRVAGALMPDSRGWYAVRGCIRHDLAVGVRQGGAVYRLGSEPVAEGDRLFTPLGAEDGCDAERPVAIAALVEEDNSEPSTLMHVYAARVGPPPVVAMVEGVIGFGAGSPRRAARARAYLAELGLDAGHAPLLVKDRRPGALWLAALTACAGGHGLMLLGLVVTFAARRRRLVRNLIATEPAEAQFFGSETLD